MSLHISCWLGDLNKTEAMSEPRAADTAEHAEHADSADTDGTEVLHVVGHNDELVR